MNEPPTPIPGYTDYGATPDGRIFSRKSGEWRELALCGKGKKAGDYLKVKLYCGLPCEYTQIAVHELIALTFIGPKPSAPKGMRIEVNHRDFDKRHNDVGNLEWLTQLENYEHAVLGGRCQARLSDEDHRSKRRAKARNRRARHRAARALLPPRPRRPSLVGVQMANHKLSEDDVRAIRALYGGQSLQSLARSYGVSKNTVWRVVRGLRWRHVE
jgi:hypothetical protein